MESRHDHKEKIEKKPDAQESVDQLISQKDQQRQAEGMAVVHGTAEGIQSEVADVIGGMEKPSEVIRETAGESGNKGDLRSGGQSDQDDGQAAQIRTGLAARPLPTQEVMIKKIRTAINLQIKVEMKKAAKLQKNLSNGTAQEYNQTIAKIRTLKETLKSLYNNTLDKVKEAYFRYFNRDGRRKLIDEV